MRISFRLAMQALICGFSVNTAFVTTLFGASLLVAIPLAVEAQTQPATYTVCPAGSTPGCNYTTPEDAVNDAARVDDDIIDIATGTYVLGDTIQADNSITILGNDSVLDANGITAIVVLAEASNVSMSNITIRNGRTDEGAGGALRMSGGVQVNLINVTFEDNEAESGGAIYNNGSNLYINIAEFSGNRATNGDGGAVFTDNLGISTLERTIIDGNTASNAGGGVAVTGNDPEDFDVRSQIHLNQSTVSNNAALTSEIIIDNLTGPLTPSTNCGIGPHGQTFLAGSGAISAFHYRVRVAGGGIPAELIVPGRLRKDGPTGPLLANTTATIPAGLLVGATPTLVFVLDQPIAMDPLATYAIETEIVGNYSIVTTLAPGSYPDGQAYSCSTALNNDDYDFQILGGSPGEGSGVFSSEGGFAGVTNTTVSGNVGDGILAISGGLIDARFNTITNNSGTGATAIPGELEPDATANGLIFITTTIIAGNGGDDCNGNMVTSGYNLIGDNTNCVLGPVANDNDIIGTSLEPVDPLLGPLQGNGGRTPAHAIDENSPAFDSAGSSDSGLPCFDFTNDQRDVARPNGPACDIGAVEFALSVGPLQTLVDAAEAGAIIDVPDGIYNESITMGDGKTLHGSSANNVVIDASNLGGSAINATGDFTLEKVRVTGGNSASNGGGIVANVPGTNFNLIDVVMDNNSAALDGGAIYLLNGTFVATNVTFENNNAGGNGGAILGGAASTITINGGLFESNTATALGGSIYNEGNLSVIFATINGSNANTGGGIYNTIGSLDIDSSTFSNNTASSFGGAIAGAGTIDILNSTLSGNSAVGNGGAIGLTAGSARLNNVTLAFNAAKGLGGPFYAESNALISFSNSLLSANTGGGTNCDTLQSLGYNLFQNAPCQTLASDITAKPQIGFLASNGGLTQTHALDPTSPAVDAVKPLIELASALSSSQLSFNGAADASGGKLIPVSGELVAGSIFAKAPDKGPFDLNGSFSTQFSFQITDPVAWIDLPSEPSGEGFTFAIAANQGVLGEPGGRLGVATTSDPVGSGLGTVSVEFDTFPGDFESTNAIGINVGGVGDGQSVISAVQTAIPGGFDDGNIWTAWIDYQADTNRLDVRVAADGVRPDLPQLSHTVDIAAEVGPTGYYGFTGGTGLAYATHSVTAWELFETNCPSFDQRGVDRPQGSGCDIGAFEAAPVALALGEIVLSNVAIDQDVSDGESYPGVTDIPIIDIPIEKLTGDTFNAPESAPLGSFPIGSFPIGSFDLRDAPLGSFPLGSFPIGSFPIGSFPLGSFPLSSLPLLTEEGWSEILDDIPELAGAPLQTVTLEQLLTISPLPDAVASIALRDLEIQESPLGSLSLPSLSLGDTTVDELDRWASNTDPDGAETVCATLNAAEPSFADCSAGDTLLGLEVKGAPITALSLSSLPLGSFPIGSFPIGSFPIGSFPMGSFPIGSFPIGSFPIGSFPIGSFPIGSFPIGSFNLLAAPIGSFPLGSFPIGSFPIGSFEIDGRSFCEHFDEQTPDDESDTCAQLGLDSSSATLADVLQSLVDNGASNLGSTPLGSFPMGSFPIGSFPIGSFSTETVEQLPFSLLTLNEFHGCDGLVSPDCTTIESLPGNTSLVEIAEAPGGLAASPLGSFPIGSFDVSDLPMGSFPIGSFEVNGTPIGSFPLGSFDLITSPLGSFPIGSFPQVIDDLTGICTGCETLADASRKSVIKDSATLSDLSPSTEFDTTTFGEVLDAMTLAVLYGPPDSLNEPGTLGEIEDTGNLTLGQLLIAMMLKTDFPWETIPLDHLDSQRFSADNFVDFFVDFALTGNDTGPLSIAVTLDEGFLYVDGSASLDVSTHRQRKSSTPISDPVIVENEDGTQTLNFELVLGGFSGNTISFRTVPPLALGDYDASATVALGSDDPLPANPNNGTLTIISDPQNDISDPSDPLLAVSTPTDVLTLGFIGNPDDNDFYNVMPPPEGARVSVFMSNPAGDNDLIMYSPVTAVEEQGQQAESAPLDSVPFEDDGVDYEGNISEEPNALEDVNLATSPLASISTNRGDLDESVSAIADDNEPFIIQVSSYNGAISDQPYTLRVKVTPRTSSPQCTARSWTNGPASTVLPVGEWLEDTNAVFLVNGARLAASEGYLAITQAEEDIATAAADAALTAINNLINAPGITSGVVVDVSAINGVDYAAWDANPCDVDAPNAIVRAITAYIEEQRVISPNLTHVTIVGSDEVIPFARKPDETSIANESTYAGEFSDNAMYGALVTRHFLSDDSYGDIDPIPWLDRYLNVPELGVGRLVESAADIQLAAENYLLFGGVLDPLTALSAGYDFVADAAKDIDDTFNTYSPVFGYAVEDALIDQPGDVPGSEWTRDDFLGATGLNPTAPGDPLVPIDQVSFNMHFDFDEALPSSGDASGDYTSNLITTADLAGADLALGIWFTVGCHSGTNVADVSVVAGAPSEDWAQSFSRLGALYLAQNAFGLGDTEALALTERLMANFARNLNGSMTIGQAHAFAKQQYFADLGLYGEYDYKALQASTLFGLPMYQYGNGAMVTDPLPPALPVTTDPISGLTSASWSLEPNITRTPTAKGDLFNVEGEVQFVHFRPLQPIVRRDVTNPDGKRASGAFLTDLETEDLEVLDIAFARPVIDFGENEPEIETDEVVFPTAFTNIANYKAPPLGGGPFAPRDQLNIIVGQFTSPLDGKSSGTERLFRRVGAQIFYRPTPTASPGSPAPFARAATGDDFVRPEFDNVQASIVGSDQAAFSIDVTDEGTVLRVAVLYLKSVTDGKGNWGLVDLIKGGGNTWTGGGPVEESATMPDDKIDYMVQAVDDNGNVANSTFKGLFYVAEDLTTTPAPGGISAVIKVGGEEVTPGDWITTDPVDVTITDQDPEVGYEYSVDYQPYQPLPPGGFQVSGDGVHIVTVRQTDGSNPLTFVIPIDTTPPQVVITSPAHGEFVTQGMNPAADYDCLDAGSGITSCVGTVPDGATVPSSTTGAQSFVVTAQDDAEKGPTMAENVYYVVKPLEVDIPVNPTAITDPVTIIASATDLDDFVETVTIDWGDGSPPEMLDMNGVSVSDFCPDHHYSTPGFYQVTLTVDYEGAHTQIHVVDSVLVYDINGGFVTGGGWIKSPPGAYTPNDSSDQDVTGKAGFGFVSKYKKGRSVPSGATIFHFEAGNLKFKATSYDWMIISGARARYSGEGTVRDDVEPYKFQITALDAGISANGIMKDGFRIKIWRAGSGDTEYVLYDSGLGADEATGNGGTTPLGGGSIKIHKRRK